MSANASKDKIISLADYRAGRLKAAQGPAPFDPALVQQTINRARVAPTGEERELAIGLALRHAEEMLQLLAIMGGEIVAYREKITMFATQVADTSTINAVLLHLLGNEARVDGQWFADFEARGGFEIEEVGTEVVIRALIDSTPDPDVGSESASQQTEDA